MIKLCVPLGIAALLAHEGAAFSAGVRRPRRSTLRATLMDGDAVSSSSTVESKAAAGRALLKAVPLGVGSAAPESKITNDDLEAVVETSDDWIRSRTGIGMRRVLGDYDEMTSGLASLATKAATSALEHGNVDPEDLDLVLLCTSSPDDLFGDATTVARNLGAKNAVAFDITAACSGFLFGTVTASQFLNSGAYRRALVIGADALSRWVDWDDRNTCILFGDGAGAMVLGATESDEEGGILGYAMHSDGEGHGELTLGFEGTGRNLATPQSTRVNKGGYSCIQMNGREVYRFATTRVPQVITEALANAGIGTDQVDWLLLHQANIRIMDAVADRLGMDKEKIITNLSEYGNTSAGSIPLALDEAIKSGKIKKGDVIACAGFGAGLSWGAAVIRWGGDEKALEPFAKNFGPPSA
eukprot:CAMPEP_0118858568 /NCGR_PEP_ID=MMETSP1163-20130328/5185_1 /TAXON_ID=124430 /ORGANISM="Phaeomonas parva, Strain CCMP2877" /LENGTH=412 /DNA_ID=CAMNT_0006792035 /DNA_START=352 /DNA_END=1590 /DNA_ORIENTATION=-